MDKKLRINKIIQTVLLSIGICIVSAFILIKMIYIVKENELLKTERAGYVLLMENMEDTYEKIIDVYKSQTKTLEQKLDIASRKIEELNVRLQYQDKNQVYELLYKLLDELSDEGDGERLFLKLLETNPAMISGYIDWLNR